jgi:hypothetical protein
MLTSFSRFVESMCQQVHVFCFDCQMKRIGSEQIGASEDGVQINNFTLCSISLAVPQANTIKKCGFSAEWQTAEQGGNPRTILCSWSLQHFHFSPHSSAASSISHKSFTFATVLASHISDSFVLCTFVVLCCRGRVTVRTAAGVISGHFVIISTLRLLNTSYTAYVIGVRPYKCLTSTGCRRTTSDLAGDKTQSPRRR